MANSILTLEGPMSRYGYKGKIFFKGTPLEVSNELADELLGSGTMARFIREAVVPKRGRKRGGKGKGVTIQSKDEPSTDGPGGTTADGEGRTWNVGNFGTKAECGEYAREVHGVSLELNFALKTLNNTTWELYRRAGEGLEGLDLWGSLRGVEPPVSDKPAASQPQEVEPVEVGIAL